MALISLAAAVAAPAWAPVLGGSVRSRAGELSPVLRVRAVFFRPGRAVLAPTGGRLVAIARAGEVPAGAPLATVVPDRGPSRGAGAGTGAAWGWRRALAAWWCVRAACASVDAAPAAAPRVGRPVLARAPGPGWFTPGWDAMATLPASGYGGLVPSDLSTGNWAAPALGTEVAAGTPLGVMGDRWIGVWLALLPEPEADAVLAEPRPASASSPGAGGGVAVWVSWTGHLAVPAVAEAAGPPAAARRTVALVSDRLGAGSGPPRRGLVQVRLPPVRGQEVPRAALRWPTGSGRYAASPGPGVSPGASERCFVAVWRAGHAHWVAVRLAAVSGSLAVVRGLPRNASVLTRPGWVSAWVAGPVPTARNGGSSPRARGYRSANGG